MIIPIVLCLALVAGPATAESGFGISAKTEIECDTDDRELRTCSKELSRFIETNFEGSTPGVGENAASVEGKIILGTGYENARIQEWMETGRLTIHDFPESRDAFEIRVIEDALVVAGSNPGSVLDGVHELEEILKEHGEFPLGTEIVTVPYFDWRILHPLSTARGGFFDYREKDFAFIRRCGGNAALMMHDWMGEKFLHSFVPSETFPDGIELNALERNREALRRYIDWAKDYGLRVALWICEMPCQGGPWVPEKARERFLDRYPEEVLEDCGTYQGKVLCLAHPLVEKHYRDLVRGLLTDFPEVELIQLFTLDSNAEFCSPESCERHKGVSKIEQRNRLIELMLEEGRKIRPDFRVLTTTWGWQGTDDFLERQASLPSGSGLFSTPDGEAWSFDRKLTDSLFAQREVCRDRGQMFLGYDILFWGDDVFFPPRDRLFDFPYGVAAKLRRWAWLGTDGVFDQWGTAAELFASNAFASREFLFDPHQPVEPVIAEIAERQYGDASSHVLAAWREIEAAQRIQSDHAYYWHPLRPNWASQLAIPPTLEDLKPDNAYARGEPTKPSGPIDHAPGGPYERAKRVGPALRKAVVHFDRARSEFETASQELDPNRPSFYKGIVSDVTPITPADQLERQRQNLELIAGFAREIAHFYDGYASVCDIDRARGDERAELVLQHREFLKETLEGTRDLADLLSEVGVPKDHQMVGNLQKRMAGIVKSLKANARP